MTYGIKYIYNAKLCNWTIFATSRNLSIPPTITIYHYLKLELRSSSVLFSMYEKFRTSSSPRAALIDGNSQQQMTKVLINSLFFVQKQHLLANLVCKEAAVVHCGRYDLYLYIWKSIYLNDLIHLPVTILC